MTDQLDAALPRVVWIEGDPPPNKRETKTRGLARSLSPLIVGMLTARPGVWARVEDEARPASQVAHKLRQYAEANGISVDAVCSRGVAYARFIGWEDTK